MLNVTHPLATNLATIKAADKGARLHLRSGQELAGKLGELGTSWVVIQELVGKEFYDAIVRLEDVTAVSIRAR